jgi:predicted nuclease of predicted toxin-antitoxin system
MRWLFHGNLTPAAAEAMKRHQQETRTPAEIGLPPDAPTADLLEAARKNQLEIMTTDAAMADALFEISSRFGRTIVLLRVGDGEIEQDDAIDRLFERYRRLSPGRLYTVTGGRVKIRQLPGAHMS